MVAIRQSNKYFFQLGKLLVSKKPEVAKELITAYMPPIEPKETDLNKIPGYFNEFCKLKELEPDDYTGPLIKVWKNNKRRLFVAVIINIYQPARYYRQRNCIAKSISDTIKQDPGTTSKMIGDVVFMYKHDDEFRDEVDILVSKIVV